MVAADQVQAEVDARRHSRRREHRAFVDAAADAGVAHLVYVSFLGADPDATFTLARDHWATEEHVRARGLRATFLRDALYADFFPNLTGEDGVIRGPAGDGAMAAVARADVAAVAATVLRDHADHLDVTYDLTGPTAITLAEAAAIVSEVRGRPVSYHPETVDEAYASRARWNPEPWQADAWVSTYTAIAEGALAEVSGDVASDGPRDFLWFIAVLSAAVGLMNLFPIPVLDGGHLVFHAYEAVAGRPPGDAAPQDEAVRAAVGADRCAGSLRAMVDACLERARRDADASAVSGTPTGEPPALAVASDPG